MARRKRSQSIRDAMHADRVQFATFDRHEKVAVNVIVARAVPLLRGYGLDVDSVHVRMDLAAVHAHTPLRLEELAAADAFTFAHDIYGICIHLDRETGQLRNCFLPRSVRPVMEGAHG